MTAKIRVFIADSQPLFRQELTHALTQKAQDIEVCGEGKVELSLLNTLETTFPDVIIVDVDYPSLSGLELSRMIKQRLPSTAIILTTPEVEDDQLFQAIKARVAAYLPRHISHDQLITIIRKVAFGEYPINETLINHPKVVKQIMEQFQDFSWGRGVESILSPLTRREEQVLKYMAQGYLNKQIAAALGVSEQTVKNHVTSILRKLHANARTQAVIIALRRGLISI